MDATAKKKNTLSFNPFFLFLLQRTMLHTYIISSSLLFSCFRMSS